MNRRNNITMLLLLVVAGLLFLQVSPVDSKQATSSSTDPAEAVADEEREKRSEIRAFYTAPPQIPHELLPGQARDCQFCHGEVRPFQGKMTVKTPHPEKSNCLQCHLPKENPLDAKVDLTKNSFEGLKEPKNGDRWSVVSPPTVPHRTFMRENCAACHDDESPYEYLRTPHEDRGECYQCHVADPQAEFKHEFK